MKVVAFWHSLLYTLMSCTRWLRVHAGHLSTTSLIGTFHYGTGDPMCFFGALSLTRWDVSLWCSFFRLLTAFLFQCAVCGKTRQNFCTPVMHMTGLVFVVSLGATVWFGSSGARQFICALCCTFLSPFLLSLHFHFVPAGQGGSAVL